MHRAHRRTRGEPRRRWLKRTIIGLAILLALVVIAGATGYIYLNSELNSIRRFDVTGLSAQASGAPIDILLVGSDSRAFVSNPGQVAAFGNPLTYGGQRSDVIVVVRLVPSTHQIEMLSIPRDTYVPIPGTHGSNRINAAFNSGPSQLVATIEKEFGIPINHVIAANFAGFSGMVDALGGVSLDFSVPVRDAFSGLNVTTTGCQQLGGAMALALVRSRHLYYFKGGTWNYDGMSDWSRIRRQQAFFHAVIHKLNSEFPNIFAINDFVRATVSDLQIDSGFSAGEMISLGLAFRGVGSSALSTEVLPTVPAVVNGADVLYPAQPYAQKVVASFLSFGRAGSSPVSGGTSTSTSTHSGSGTTPTSRSTTTTAPASTGVTVPSSQVVFDNAATLPEPWNPTAC